VYGEALIIYLCILKRIIENKCKLKNCGKTLTWHCGMCCNPANGRVDIEDWSAYKIQLPVIELILSLSAD
jgi:hypothetical protein